MSQALSSTKVLLIEDNPGDARLVREMLAESQGGFLFELCCADRLSRGLEWLTKSQFDLLLLDLSLPDSHGLETFHRAQGSCPTIPVVLLTGLGDESIAVKALSEGAQDYLVKGRVDSDLLTRSVSYAIERKRAQEAVRRQTDLYETLLRVQSDVGEGVVLTEGPKLLYGNEAICHLSGYSLGELIQMPSFYSQIFPSLPPDFVPQGDRFEAPLLQKSGQFRYVEVFARPVQVNQDQRLVSIIRDTTERKRSEERLREQAELLDRAQDAIIVHDMQGRVVFWNKSAERFYGWSARETLGQEVRKILYPNTPQQLEQAQSAVLQNGEWLGELHQSTRQGKDIIVESRWSLVLDKHGHPKSILVVNTDITERKLLASQMLRNQRMESIGTLASGIAHDLNNALAPVMMAISLLRGRLQNKQNQYLLDIISAGAERGAAMVKQVLSFARGVEGEKTRIQVPYLVNDIAKILRQTLPKSIEVTTTLAPELWPILGNATQFYQLLMNICLNARDAMADGGKLLIEVENRHLDESYARIHIDAHPGPYLIVRIVDSGSGIPPQILARIFEPFFTTKEIGRGTGLGLSTAMSIVKSHGGFINVYSEPGRGTQFEIYFPAELSPGEEISQQPRPLTPLGQGELILLVDDEPSIRDIAREILEIHGYCVLLASDGAEALQQYQAYQDKIQLVIMDMMMPHMDGPAAIEALRKLNPAVRIIATSGLSPTGQAPELTEKSPDAFLLKPYTTERLLTTVARALGQVEEGSSKHPPS